MDPKTGQFHNESEYEEEHETTMPTEWPRFQEGETVAIKGYDFELVRINRSSLVFRPVLPAKETSARRVLDKMRA
jgi:hypothetical protein